ncbi:DUF2971 domain-containing protein [Shewanella basaltis]|uniref:DUF2971 domain-containing protein n=1 Tax=Shewanella basaltis TaxID=472183 RepID=UPI00200F3351|nr:DUF2971 domain-containing protein [Shewanella basaltis]MCL1115617.1 DUF2971 domain-containing protein [Shewanella basaltis]
MWALYLPQIGAFQLAKVKVGKSVSLDTPLWRYMSLDKLISLLEDNILYFTPLDTYRNSDPFEGYMPKVAFEAFAEIFGSQVKELDKAHEQLKARAGKNADQLAELSKMKDGILALSESTKHTYKTISKGITVNCWHANKSESEAMWKLYSDNGKGIAVKTSVSSLVKSIEHFQQDILVQLGAVKYLDFNDDQLSPKDCVTDGNLSPLLKRSSFSHENEARLFTVPKIDTSNVNDFKSKPEFIKTLALDLIEEVYISPFAGEPFVSSVKAICKKYSIPHETVKESKLLEGHEELLDSISQW